MTKIRISHHDGREEIFEFDASFGTPSDHALAIMEDLFPKEAELDTIYSAGDCWYVEGQAEAQWYETGETR